MYQRRRLICLNGSTLVQMQVLICMNQSDLPHDLSGQIAVIPEAEEIAAQFRAARARKGVSQRDLSARAGVNAGREFRLLRALGQDLPGAITMTPAEGDDSPAGGYADMAEGQGGRTMLRFSLAGVQLKFSAVHAAGGGLTIPASGIGGNWIVKLRQRRRSVGNAIIAAFNDAAQNAPRSARRKFHNTLNINNYQFLRSVYGGCCFRHSSAASICDCDCQSIA
ncbi:HipA domain-containing protein [Rhodobacter capsulatus]|uniref:hypothetical protein n=1 Tax=Rhodobacter capsulatus TaxID=1061 RepID=UPI001039405C|nr:hypothetical protein [Rhodobacter capsulatus]